MMFPNPQSEFAIRNPMPFVTVQLDTPLHRSFRVEQVAGMFDVPVNERLRHSLTAELPGLEEPWAIGAIVGPSGSGKTTLARAAYGKALYQPPPWPEDRAIIECLGESPDNGRRPSLRGGALAANRPWAAGLNDAAEQPPSIKDLTRLLTAVGLGSVPTWLKPYQVLSTGEKFRADLARALLE